jgi:hypothetical protein
MKQFGSRNVQLYLMGESSKSFLSCFFSLKKKKKSKTGVGGNRLSLCNLERIITFFWQGVGGLRILVLGERRERTYNLFPP